MSQTITPTRSFGFFLNGNWNTHGREVVVTSPYDHSVVLENPIGLEDYRRLVPYTPLQQQYAAELSQTYEKMRDYQKSYYPGAWKPEYEVYVQDQASVLDTGEYPRDAWSSALTYQMIYEQPVVYEVSEISRPTLLIIGQADRTVVGKNRLPPSLQSVAGQYPELGRRSEEHTS